MKIDPDKIDRLIASSISGNASTDELNILRNWLNDSEENRNHYNKSVATWERSKTWLSDSLIKEDKYELQTRLTSQLTVQIRRSGRMSFLYKIAAVLLIPITFAVSYYFFQNTTSVQVEDSVVQTCEITAPKGHVSKCILPDGSEVWINTNSSVIYKTDSFNKKTREVELIGEAYFEVTKNSEKPFKVKTKIADINVTGTSFNVKAYPESNIIETVLSEGSVLMQINSVNKQTAVLCPGEKALFKTGEKEVLVEPVDADFYTSWRNGEILFKDATLNDLISELERIYDIQFHLKNPALGAYRFRGMFSYNNNLIEALEKIKRTAGINYYIENKEVWLTMNK